MISKACVICPYCKKEHSKNVAIGTSGLINYNGCEKYVVCNRCGKGFSCYYEVLLTYKTKKCSEEVKE